MPHRLHEQQVVASTTTAASPRFLTSVFPRLVQSGLVGGTSYWGKTFCPGKLWMPHRPHFVIHETGWKVPSFSAAEQSSKSLSYPFIPRFWVCQIWRFQANHWLVLLVREEKMMIVISSILWLMIISNAGWWLTYWMTVISWIRNQHIDSAMALVQQTRGDCAFLGLQNNQARTVRFWPKHLGHLSGENPLWHSLI